jgi:putative phosphoribosyl transferase
MMPAILFQNRQDAGRQLAAKIAQDYAFNNPVVLALPRGGIPVAAAVARLLKVLLGVVIVRKLGVPWQPELAFGALAAVDGTVTRVIHESILSQLHLSQHDVQKVEIQERQALQERQIYYRQFCKAFSLENRSVLLVDDGLATGASMQVAIAAVREGQPAKVIVAVPVIAPDSITEMSQQCNELVYLAAPVPFSAVGNYYAEFEPPGEAEIRQALTGKREQG